MIDGEFILTAVLIVVILVAWFAFCNWLASN